MQKKIDSALEGLFEKEEQFKSHISIARLKYVNDSKGFMKYVKNIAVKEIKFKVSEFKLKKSELRLMGSVYTDLDVYSAEVNELKKD